MIQSSDQNGIRRLRVMYPQKIAFDFHKVKVEYAPATNQILRGRKAMVRPTGVTVLAVLDFIGAAFCVLAGLGMMLGGGFIASMLSQQQGGSAGLMAAIGAAAGVIFLVIAAVAILLGWGLLKLKEWARIITIVLAGLGALGALIALATVFAHFAAVAMFVVLCRLAINGLIIWYLLQPHVRAAFQGAQVRAAGA
jgi:hypothetical protein